MDDIAPTSCAIGLRFARQITTSLAVASEASIAFGHGKTFSITGSRLKEADAFLTISSTEPSKLSGA